MCVCVRERERGQRKRSLATVKIRCSMQCTNVYILHNSTHRPPLTIRPLSSSSCQRPWLTEGESMEWLMSSVTTYIPIFLCLVREKLLLGVPIHMS